VGSEPKLRLVPRGETVLAKYDDGALLWRPATGAVVRERVDAEGYATREVVVRFSMCKPGLAAELAREVESLLRRLENDRG
jgi:hypothetical protein